MAKQLGVIVSSVSSEVVLDKVVEAAKVSKGAAEVIRDANGRVVEVRIALPDSASEAARAAIAATPGVANVVVSDILPGTVGLDGSTLSGWANIGWEEGAEQLGGTHEWSLSDSGTMVLKGTLGAGNEQSRFVNSAMFNSTTGTFNNSMAPYPNSWSWEARFKMAQGTSFNSMIVSLRSDQGGTDNYLIGQNGRSLSTGTITCPGAQIPSSFSYGVFHVVRLEYVPTVGEVTGSVKCFLDGVEQTRLATTPNMGLNGASSITFDGIGMVGEEGSEVGTLEIDYIRWTSL